jgi:hypothetical protein
MSEPTDPRTRGFNYSSGWGSEPKPPIYLVAARIARQLGTQARELSTKAWALEMADPAPSNASAQ